MKIACCKFLLFLAAVPVVAVLMQVGWFYALLSLKGSDPPEKSDAIVVFAGDADRVEAGFSLALNGAAERLIISPATEEAFESANGKYGPIGSHLTPIIENKARITFENALWTRRIVHEYGLKSVILVTTLYHMPRSYFLARLLLIGTGVRIQRYAVVWRSEYSGRMFVGCPPRLLYAEMLKFWGSLFELARYLVTGSLPGPNPSEIQPFRQLRSLLLQ